MGAERASVEVMLPKGGCVKVGFSHELSSNPEHEAAVVRTMLDADGADVDVCKAIVDYAERSGLGARFFLGTRDVVVEIFETARAARSMVA